MSDTTESERLTAKEIANFIMNGGVNATGEGRENLQETGIEMIEAHTAQRLSKLKEKIEDKGYAHSIPEDMYCNGYNSALNEILQLIELIESE